MGIIPVFLLLGLSISIFVCYFEHKETLWGLHESASSMAVTTSEFFFGQSFETLISDTTQENQQKKIIKPLYTALRYKNFQWIFAYSFYKDNYVCSIKQNDNASYPEQDFKLIARQLKNEDILFSDVQTTEDNQKFIRAYRMVYDSKYQPAGIVGVQIDANALTDNFYNSVIQSLKGVTLCIVAGLFCSLFVSRTLRRDIDVLNISYEKDIASLASKDRQNSKISFIREIKDLGNTFETMFSVLKTVMNNSWQNILDVELLRSERDIAKKFKTIYLSKNRLKDPMIFFLSETIDTELMNTFTDFFEYNNRIYCIFGRMIAPENDLKTTLCISSMITFFKISLHHGSTIEALEKTIQLYDCNDFQMLEWEKESLQLKLYDYKPSSKQFDIKSLYFEDGKMKVFHNLSDEVEKRMALYLKTYYQKNNTNELNSSKKLFEETFLLPLGAEELMKKLTSLSKEYADIHGGVIVLILKLK